MDLLALADFNLVARHGGFGKAARAPIIMAVAFVLAWMRLGMTLASATHRPRVPCTARRRVVTARPSSPRAAVPVSQAAARNAGGVKPAVEFIDFAHDRRPPAAFF